MPANAARTPIAIAQRNSAPVGLPRGGDVGDGERERPESGPVVEPDVDERADAGSEQARDEHDAHQRAAEPAASIRRKAPASGEPSSVAMAAKLPAAPITTARHLGCVSLDQVHGEHAMPASDRDQRRLGAEHDAEAESGERGEDDAGEVDRPDGAGRP